MDFSLTETQRGLQQMARDFVRTEILPRTAKWDSIPDQSQAFPWDVVEKGAKLGLNGLVLPEEYGGGGEGILTQTLVTEELSYGDPGVSKVYTHNWKGMFTFLERASEEQIREVMPLYLDDPRALIAICITEPNAGTDNAMHFDEVPAAGPMLSAVPKNGGWVLNGMKHFIALARYAKIFFIYARTDKTVPWTEGTSLFLALPPTEGLRIPRVHDKVGLRNYPQFEVSFEDVFIPEKDLLGELNGSRRPRRHYPMTSAIECAATTCGMARRTYDVALEQARERVQGGKPIIEHDAIGLMLVEMYTRLEAARTLTWRAAWQMDHPDQDDPKLQRVAKVLAVDTVNFIAARAVEIWGGMGVMQEAPVEKLHRDAVLFYHMGNTQQVNRKRAMEQL